MEFGSRPNRDNNGPSNGDSVNRSTTPYGPVRSPRWKPPFRSSISPLSTPCPIHPVYRSLLGERVGERWMQLRCWLRAPFLQDTCWYWGYRSERAHTVQFDERFWINPKCERRRSLYLSRISVLAREKVLISMWLIYYNLLYSYFSMLSFQQ